MCSMLHSVNPEMQRIEKPESLKATARAEIKKMLVTGRWEQGVLYSAGSFADILGVSRTPVREALLELSAEGYLIAQDGKGFRIKEFSEDEIRDFFETRRVIELYVLERVAGRLTAGEVQTLRALQKEMRDMLSAGDETAFLDADKAFHLHLIQCHHNQHLISIMNNIRDLISVMGHEAIVRKGRSQEVIGEHQAVIDAIEQGSAIRAVAAMRSHLEATENFVVAQNHARPRKP